MTRHILFIDPIEKLVVKKDSTIMFALTLLELGHEVYFLFEKDFYFQNNGSGEYRVSSFKGEVSKEDFYVSNFSIKEELTIKLQEGDCIHMRIDPPFDTRYLRYLWMLKAMEVYGVKIFNSADGILKYNEKLYAYQDESSIESYVGSSPTMLEGFIKELNDLKVKSVIMKPLDLYQGIGVEKQNVDKQLIVRFIEKVKEVGGPLVVQPFIESVTEGEIRSLFFKGVHLGSILKVPPKGEYLANIAQGAKYHEVMLNESQMKSCKRISHNLQKEGVYWIAYDILEDSISEVNITCPGLLVEVSNAVSRNLAKVIIENL